MTVKSFPGLTGNLLKILAMITMTLDHIGMILAPNVPILRILGRLSMPIFAYMIAEGCRYTHDRRRYLLRLAGLGLACQMVYFFAMGSLYQCILITFSLSVCLIWAVDRDLREHTPASLCTALAVLAAISFLCLILPRLLPGFDIDYGFFGVLLPVAAYFGKSKAQRLTFASLCLILLSSHLGGIQWFSLGAIPILALYNGQRGKYRIGTFFYLYYPAHLVVLQGIGLLIK